MPPMGCLAELSHVRTYKFLRSCDLVSCRRRAILGEIQGAFINSLAKLQSRSLLECNAIRLLKNIFWCPGNKNSPLTQLFTSPNLVAAHRGAKLKLHPYSFTWHLANRKARLRLPSWKIYDRSHRGQLRTHRKILAPPWRPPQVRTERKIAYESGPRDGDAIVAAVQPKCPPPRFAMSSAGGESRRRVPIAI